MDAATLIRELRSRASLTQAQLASRAGTSQPAVARYENGSSSPSVATLERLVRATGADLVLSTTAAPASDLSGARAAKLRRYRHEIVRIARAHRATNLRIFGSVARGDDQPASDIDILVDFDSSKGLFPILAIGRELEELLDERVDVAPVDMLREDIAKNALIEAVPL